MVEIVTRIRIRNIVTFLLLDKSAPGMAMTGVTRFMIAGQPQYHLDNNYSEVGAPAFFLPSYFRADSE